MNRDHSVIFEIVPKYCILDSFVDYEGYSISSMEFFPTVVDIMVIWIKFAHFHFCSLIPKISTFTLAIYCLTTSNLPWFIDLTFQVPMQYWSLQHWILLSPADTSTTGCYFCFGSASSFFLELFLYSFPVACCTHQPGELIFWCHIFLSFHTLHGFLKARTLKWFAIPFSSGPRFIRAFHHDPFTLGGPAWHGS